MQLYTICFVVSLCGVALAIPTRPLRPRTSTLKSNTRVGITGGTTTSIKRFPYMASIESDDGFIGSGIIVGKKFILTSAYLLLYETGLQVRVGSGSISGGGQLLNVSKTIVHEKFNGFSHDAALIQLSKAIKYGKSAKPLKIASKEGKNGTSAVVSGFGAEGLQSPPSSNDNEGKIQKGKQNVISRDTCQQSYYASNITLDESNSCAYSPTVCPCYVDLGDPLVQKKKLLGFYIGGTFCCKDSKPEIYTSAPAINEWVKDKMKAAGYNVKEDVGHYF